MVEGLLASGMSDDEATATTEALTTLAGDDSDYDSEDEDGDFAAENKARPPPAQMMYRGRGERGNSRRPPETRRGYWPARQPADPTQSTDGNWVPETANHQSTEPRRHPGGIDEESGSSPPETRQRHWRAQHPTIPVQSTEGTQVPETAHHQSTEPTPHPSGIPETADNQCTGFSETANPQSTKSPECPAQAADRQSTEVPETANHQSTGTQECPAQSTGEEQPDTWRRWTEPTHHRHWIRLAGDRANPDEVAEARQRLAEEIMGQAATRPVQIRGLVVPRWRAARHPAAPMLRQCAQRGCPVLVGRNGVGGHPGSRNG